MHTGKAGRDLIKSFETLRLKAYICPAGKLTIGWGHTGPDVYAGQIITERQADDLFLADCETAAAGVTAGLKVPTTQNQFDALVSLAFNIGVPRFRRSDLLRLLNAGDVAGAAAEFPKWRLAAGALLPGLVRRRMAERALFLT